MNRIIRPDLELGVICWINANLGEARKIEVDALDVKSALDSTITTFCERTGLTREALEERGAEARERGCVADDTEKSFQLSTSRRVSVLRTGRRGWQAIDGTVSQDPRDDAARYKVGPRWRQNSCYVDSILFCAVMLDAGRIQIDQLPPLQFKSLPLAARSLRRIVSAPWGLMEETLRDQNRDTMVNILAGCFPDHFQKGGYADVKLGLEHCFVGLPQLSFTMIKARVCCDRRMVAYGDHQAKRFHYYALQTANPHVSTQELLASWLRRRPLPTHAPQDCTRGAACTRKQERVNLVIDRMPPTLMVLVPVPTTQSEDARRKHFEPLDLTYETTRGSSKVSYEPIGCIMMRNWNHYIVRWKARNEHPEGQPIVHYDSLENPNISYKKDWWDGVIKSSTRRGGSQTGVVTLFYRQVQNVEIKEGMG